LQTRYSRQCRGADRNVRGAVRNRTSASDKSLIFRLKTAQALGLTIPPEVPIQAEEVMR